MLLQNTSFRDLDSLFDQVSGWNRAAGRPMPMDAYRRGDDVWVHIDLPGVAEDSLDISVERNVLTVTAERSWQRQETDRHYLAERHRGQFRRQVSLGEGLDAARIEADYHDGVLTLRIPVAPQAKPRKIELKANRLSIDATSSDVTADATSE
jgi:HSP20 family protein